MRRPAKEPAGSRGVAVAAAMSLVLAAGPARAEEAGEAELTLIRVSSEPPGAEVAIDGHPCGRTPALVEVAPGTHEVAVGGGPARLRSTVIAVEAETVEVRVELPRAAPSRGAPAGPVVRQTADGERRPRAPEELEPRAGAPERRPPAGPWHARVPRWPWFEVALSAGALWRTFSMPIDPAVDRAFRTEASLQTAASGMGYVAGAGSLFPFAASRIEGLRGLGIEAGGGGVVDVTITSPHGGTVEAGYYDVDLGALYRVDLAGEDVGVELEARAGWHRTVFSMGDVNNDLIPTFEYDTVRLGGGLRVPLGTRHLVAELAAAYLLVAGVGDEAATAYDGSGSQPTAHGGEVTLGLLGRLAGLELGLRWRGRWLSADHEGVGRGFGFDPTTVIGMGGNGILSTGPSEDSYQAVLVHVGYRFGPTDAPGDGRARRPARAVRPREPF